MKIKKINFETSEEATEEGNSKFRKQKKGLQRQQLENGNKYDITNNTKKNLKSGRLIVRNLPFKANENSIKEHFSTCGEVTEINLLKKDGRLIGCCFVQYDKKTNAAKAIARLSGKEFLGRPIVVDWALSKDRYNKSMQNYAAPTESPSVKEEVISVKEESDDSEVEQNIDDDLETNVKEEDMDSDEEDSEDSENEEGGSEDSENEGDSGDSENEEEEKGKSSQPLNNFTKAKREKQNKKYHFKYDPEDINDGRTVFFKNVPFSANDDDLLECAKKVGPVIYAVICVDPLTEHSKGTAFVKFNDKSVVDDLILGKSKLVLKGEKLDAFLALKKTQVANLKEDKRPKDNRNLYLLREGLILAGSPAAEGVSESDMYKRLRLEHWKTKILKNLNKFVSSKRLVIHNIPSNYDDNKLKQIVKENSPKGSVVSECRIMRNMKDIDEKGLGKSKGFGFVSFSKHEDALEALRKMNNNPTIFFDKKRPIVGFSIENRIALRIQEKRKEKSKNITENKSNKNVSYKKNQNKGDISKTKQNESNSRTPDKPGGKRKFVDEDNLPTFCGYTAKPGSKKMRTGRELSSQAALHHKAVIEKKKSMKKRKFFARRNNKNRKK